MGIFEQNSFPAGRADRILADRRRFAFICQNQRAFDLRNLRETLLAYRPIADAIVHKSTPFVFASAVVLSESTFIAMALALQSSK
jgi:hypothetical protein